MQTNGPRLQDLMAEEATTAEDLSPSGDAAVRAQLRFVADALAANAGPGQQAELAAFRTALPERLTEAEAELTHLVDMLGEAAAFEAGKQFGDQAPEDPALASMLERRIRVGAWMRLFLRMLDEARPERPPASPAALEWMGAHQQHLADTIFSMDRRAKELEMARGGPDAVANPEVVNRIGQAAMLQSHVRFLVEALAQAV